LLDSDDFKRQFSAAMSLLLHHDCSGESAIYRKFVENRQSDNTSYRVNCAIALAVCGHSEGCEFLINEMERLPKTHDVAATYLFLEAFMFRGACRYRPTPTDVIAWVRRRQRGHDSI
jgi:hypothetical protein